MTGPARRGTGSSVRLAVEEKHFRADVDPEQIAHELYANAFGLHFLSRLGDRATAERRTRAAFDRILESARPRTS